MNRFTFIPMNYSIDWVLDSLLKTAMKSGIRLVYASDGYHITINFKDGSIFNGWNTNKYYAWLSRGTFYYPNATIETKYQWEGGRPSRNTMVKLLKMLKHISY